MSEEHAHDDCDCASTGIDRRGFVKGCGAALAFAAAGTSLETVAAQENSADVAELLDPLPSNWGRWGEDDELGALNLLDGETAYRGMLAAVQGGPKNVGRFTLQLSMTGEVINPDPDQPDVLFPNADGSGPQWPSTDTGDPAFPPRTPARRTNTTGEGGSEVAGGIAFVDDKFAADFFLQGTTHVDALGHAWYGDQIYNGFSTDTTNAVKQFDTALAGTTNADAVPDDPASTLEPFSETTGLSKAGITNAAEAGIAGRGVLLDVGRHLDVSDEKGRLPLGYGITLEDLQSTAEAQGVDVEERDILLIRTGAVERTRDPEAEWAPLQEPGLAFSEELVEWFAEKDIPYVGADNLAVEKVAQTIDGETYVIPLHGAFLRNLGVTINEILWLKELGAACAEDGVYDFLFTAAPLKVERGTGAPVNPVVLKATGRDDDDSPGDDDGENESGDDNGGQRDDDESDDPPGDDNGGDNDDTDD
ncbi:cyclase family protein [Halomarina litorea]|uniref:cyclase family protein n=1 Tax=Halomarina litorea TaxID=2961595 RepID=UPI0020C369C3|nr:cyclase family protein [Halomarina sp. BCD28]